MFIFSLNSFVPNTNEISKDVKWMKGLQGSENTSKENA